MFLWAMSVRVWVMCCGRDIYDPKCRGDTWCDQYMGPVGVVAGCGQWVVDLLNYLIMKYPTPCVCKVEVMIVSPLKKEDRRTKYDF